MKDYVFFIGPRKTGTTSFYEVLRQAGAPVSPTVKESFFFDQKAPDLQTYEARYALNPDQPFAEISPSYFTSVDAIEHIHANFPDAKIIITLRDPLKRAMSALSHVRRIGFVPENWNEDCSSSKHVTNILNASNYKYFIDLWSDRFPGRVCVIKQVANGKYERADIESVGNFIDVGINPDIFYETKANPAMEARSQAVSGLVQKMKTKLIKNGAFGALRFMKMFKPLFYRTQSKHSVDMDAVEFFSAQLWNQTEYFKNLKSVSFR